MADMEIRDLSGNTLVSFTRMPNYPWPQAWDKNVVVDFSHGRKARAQKHGEPRMVQTLAFTFISQQQAAQFGDLLRDYGAGEKPIVLNFAGQWQWTLDGSKVLDGGQRISGDFQCRIYPNSVQVIQTHFQKFQVTCEFTQDL